jgi:hypothetical protein
VADFNPLGAGASVGHIPDLQMPTYA